MSAPRKLLINIGLHDLLLPISKSDHVHFHYLSTHLRSGLTTEERVHNIWLDLFRAIELLHLFIFPTYILVLSWLLYIP
jgi:hypothetical protein